METISERGGSARYGAGWMAAALAAVALLGLHTIANSDFWLHLAAGRWMAEHGMARTDPFSFALGQGTRWVHVPWLYDRLLFAMWQAGGAGAVTLSHAALTAVAFALMIGTMRGRVTPLAGAGAVLLSGWLLAPLFSVRPSIFALVLAALFTWRIERGGTGWTTWSVLVPLQVIWANVHGSFLLGPLIGLLGLRSAVPAPPTEAGRRRPPPAWALPLALLAVTLLNPHGIHAHVHPVMQLVQPDRGWLIEWISPFAGLFPGNPARLHTTLALGFIALGFVLVRQLLPFVPTALAVIGAFLLVRWPQHMDWAALLILPFTALALQSLGEFVSQRLPAGGRAWRIAAAGALAVLIALTAWSSLSGRYLRHIGSAARPGLGVQEDLVPALASRAIAADVLPAGRMLNLPIDGGALLWFRPDVKVFTDARGDVYPAEFYAALHRGLSGDDVAWQTLKDRWKPESILLNCCWPGAGAAARWLIERQGWALRYFDGITAILARPGSRSDAALLRTGAAATGLLALEKARKAYAEQLSAGRTPANHPRLFGAAAFYQALGRYTEAASLYSLLTRSHPDLGSAWLHLGISLVEQGRGVEAIPVLRHARRLLPREALILLWTGRALEESGQKADAERAYAQARELNAELTDAFRRPRIQP